MPRHARFTPSLAVGPDWLERLRTAVHAVLPALDEAFVFDDTPYICQRLLTEQGPSLLYTEKWLDPRTYSIKRTWSLSFEAGPFVGPLPAPVLQQQVDVLLTAITLGRARLQRPPPPPPFRPYRYAHRPFEREDVG